MVNNLKSTNLEPIEEQKYNPDAIVVDDTQDNETQEIKTETNSTNYEDLIEFLRNENDELIELLNDRTKIKQHPYKFILDTFQIADHQKKITDNPDFESYYDTALIEIATKDDLDILIENLCNVKEIGIHCGNCENFYHIKVGVLILRTVDKCYLIDLTKLRSMVTLLTQVFINPNIVKIFYNSDVIMKELQQDLSLYFVNIFDINLARNILQIEELPLRDFLEQNYETYGKVPRDPMIYVKRPLPDFVKNYCKYLVNYHIHAYRNLKNQLIAEDNNLYYQILDECNNKCKIVYQHSDKTEILQIANEIKLYQSYQWRLLPKLYKLRDQLAKSNDKNPKQIISNRSLIQLILKNPVDKDDLNGITHSMYFNQNIDKFFETFQQLQEEMQINVENPQRRQRPYKYREYWQKPPYKRAQSDTADPAFLNSVNENLKRVADGLSTLMATNNQIQDASTSQQQQQQAGYSGGNQEDDEEYNDANWEINRQGDGGDYDQNQHGYQDNYQYNNHKHKKDKRMHTKNGGKFQRGRGYDRNQQPPTERKRKQQPPDERNRKRKH